MSINPKIPPQGSLSVSPHSTPHPQTWATMNHPSVTIDEDVFLEFFFFFLTNIIKQCEFFCVWLFPLSTVSVKFILVSARITSLFLFIAESLSIVKMYHNLFIHLLMDI